MTVVLGEDAEQMVGGLRDPSKQVQGAGIELTVAKILRFKGEGTLGFSNDERILPETEPIAWKKEGSTKLAPGVYLADLNEVVEIPRDKVAIAVPRSSLLRMGVTLGTALFDPGYKGKPQVLVAVLNKSGVNLFPNTRLLQLVYLDLERPCNNVYNGIYQGAGIK
jgi:dUTP pyrophosphatase